MCLGLMNLGRTPIRPFLLLLIATPCWFLARADLPSELNAAAEALERGEYLPAETRLLAIEKRLTPESGNSLTEATILLKLAAIYTAQNRYNELTSVLHRAIAIYENLPGEYHNLSTALNNLGAVCERTGKITEAMGLYLRALQVREAALGPDSPELAALLSNLGNIEREQGLYAAAERRLLRGLQLSLNAAGTAVTRSRILNNLGLLYRTEERYAEADANYRQALALEGEIDTGTTLNNLADLLNAEGKLAEAEEVIRRALELQQRRFGAGSVEVAGIINNLGGICDGLGKNGEARTLFERASGILEAKFGPESPLLGPILNNLGRLYLAAGDLKKADPVLKRALRLVEKTNGPDHLEVASTLTNLAILNASQRHYREAEILNERSLRILTKMADSTQPSMRAVLMIGAVLNNMGFVSFGRHRYATAEEQFLKAIETKRKTGSALDVSVAPVYRNLGDVYVAEKRFQDAKRCYGEAIRIWDATAPQNSQLAAPLENYAKVLRKTEDYAEAELAETRALGIRVRSSLRN